MHGIGPGFVPPPPRRPSKGVPVVERVAFTVLSFFSIGFLTWASLLRAAFVTRRRAGWLAMCGAVGCAFLGVVFVAVDPGTDEIEGWQGNLGMMFLMVNAIAGTAYYLYSDIRYRAAATPLPRQAHGPQHGGYPAPTYAPPGFTAPPQPYRPAPAPPAPRGWDGAGPSPHPGRIDQVRAELDELSAYLRAEEQAGRPTTTGGVEYPGTYGWTPEDRRPDTTRPDASGAR